MEQQKPSMPYGIDLSGKVAVITGGGGVLCGSFAEALAQCGARIAVIDLNKAAAQAVADKIAQQGGCAIAVEADCLQKEALLQARDEVERRLGACDILINGAGGNHPKGSTDNETMLPDMLDDPCSPREWFGKKAA